MEYIAYTSAYLATLLFIIPKGRRKWTTNLAASCMVNGTIALCAPVFAVVGWKRPVLEDLLVRVSELSNLMITFTDDIGFPALHHIEILCLCHHYCEKKSPSRG